MVEAYNFSTESDILSPDQIDATRNVSKLLSDMDTLDGVLHQQIGWR